MSGRLHIRRLPAVRGRARYTVYAGNETICGQTWRTREEAEEWLARTMVPEPPKRRPCLCCGAPFMSTWIGNRLCDTCKGHRLGKDMAG
ncbi:MAG: hypothetical protein Q4G49_03225 [Paracoccus sp. (in: a-proteobacteria)]|nr:hypothetical protein [Paracoccus sp. (in: a-proteobacteria)]